MNKSIKEFIYYNILNIPGWHTNRKIVVIESDDWGSLRMPSRKIYDHLISKGIRVDKLPYNRFDSLESENDLNSLFEVLSSVKDRQGNYPVFTTNTVVANPDFDKIRDSDFQEYFYEPFTVTLNKYPDHANSFALLKEGISKKLMLPQFHGREHINVSRWMKALKNNTGNTRLAFDLNMYDLSTGYAITENSFMDALYFENENEISLQKNTIIEGTKLFNEIFGFRSESFMAPCYIWSNQLNFTLSNNGIRTFQGGFYQFEPMGNGEKKSRKRINYTGKTNSYAQKYLIRNVSFEPSENNSYNWIGNALSQITSSFFWRKPAIISSHRMNYMGSIDPANRSQNLKQLNTLLKEILKKWSDVEFLSSSQLSDLIHNEK